VWPDEAKRGVGVDVPERGLVSDIVVAKEIRACTFVRSCLIDRIECYVPVGIQQFVNGMESEVAHGSRPARRHAPACESGS